MPNIPVIKPKVQFKVVTLKCSRSLGMFFFNYLCILFFLLLLIQPVVVIAVVNLLSVVFVHVVVFR